MMSDSDAVSQSSHR